MYASLTLAQDKSTKRDDKARLVGYICKRSQSKIIVGCALYIHVLKSTSLLSLTLQEDKLDLLQVKLVHITHHCFHVCQQF